MSRYAQNGGGGIHVGVSIIIAYNNGGGRVNWRDNDGGSSKRQRILKACRLSICSARILGILFIIRQCVITAAWRIGINPARRGVLRASRRIRHHISWRHNGVKIMISRRHDDGVKRNAACWRIAAWRRIYISKRRDRGVRASL